MSRSIGDRVHRTHNGAEIISETNTKKLKFDDNVVIVESQWVEDIFSSSPDESSSDTEVDDAVHEGGKIASILSRLISYDGSDGPLQAELFAAISETSLSQSMENSGFVPRETLSQIINEESVAHELERMEQSLKRRLQFWRRPPDTGTIEQEARVVCGNPTSKGAYVHSKPRKCFRKIFAILLLIGQPGAIWEFVNEGICDADLPLSHRLNATGSVASELTRKASPDHSIGCLEDWNTRKLSQLERWQWKVLVPCFSRAEDGKVQHQHFEDKAILPFTYRKRVNSGSHGEIFKIKIHPDHHNFDISLSNEYFALKIISGEEEEFRQEVRMLKRVHNSHSHLISLFATYQHSSSFHLIMPWAECDLRTYWKVKFPSPSRDDDTALWMARQCEGIAEALYHIHHHETNSVSSLFAHESAATREQRTRVLNPRRGKWTAQERPSYVVFGRHGDIKPSNLLWFPNYQDPEDRGIIKISDLGVGEFSTISTARSTSSSIGHSPMYRPPECDLAGAAITSSYDVWTLGCLYLEFITWYLGGWALLHEFEELRIQATQGLCRTSAFFEIITDVSASGHSQRATVKPIVTQFMDRLRQDKNCSKFLSEFIHLIEHSMLIVDHKLGEIGPGRISCHKLYSDLGGLISKYFDPEDTDDEDDES